MVLRDNVSYGKVVTHALMVTLSTENFSSYFVVNVHLIYIQQILCNLICVCDTPRNDSLEIKKVNPNYSYINPIPIILPVTVYLHAHLVSLAEILNET